MPDKRKYDTGSIKIKIVPVINWDFFIEQKEKSEESDYSK
jgi:hypothetical protein